MRKLAFVLFAGAPLLYACGGAAPPAVTPAGEHAPGSRIKPPGEARVGETSTCPVSGEEFDVTEGSPKVEHEGKTYYFCCSGCAKKFAADPSKYLSKPSE